MGNALSNFWHSLVGGLGQNTQNAANNFVNNAQGQSGNTPVQPKPMGFNLNPSTISISQGDVQNVGNGLLDTIKKYGSSYLTASGAGQNPILGAGLTFAQSLFPGIRNQQVQTNTQAGTQNTNLTGTIQDTLGNNTNNYGLGPFSLSSTGGQTGSNSSTSNFNINDLPQGQNFSYTTPEGQSYLNSLNGYQNQIMKFYTEADETHNHELSQINAEMQNVKNKQEQENIYQAEAARQSGISTGLAFFTPQLYQNAIKNTIDVGIQKIADITVKQNGLILQADKASLQEKRTILGQLQDLQQQKFQASRTMKEDFMKQKQFEDQQHETVINSNLPAIYEQAQKLPPAEQGAFIAQAAQRLGVPITQLASSFRQFGVNENKNISAIYNQIAEKLATTNPQLALEIAQKSLTPEGRQELMNSPYFKALSAMGSLGGLYGPNDASSVVDIMAQLESSGGKIINNPDKDGINSVFQYQRGTWAEYSRKWNKAVNGVDAPVPEKDILKYERAVTGYIVNQWMEGEGLTGEEVAARWNGAHIVNGKYVANNPDHIKKYRELAGNVSGTSGSINKQQALAQAKQNLATLGGTKINVSAIAGINNTSSLWSKAVLLLPTAQAKEDARLAFHTTLVAQKLKELRNIVGEENFGLLATSQQNFKQLYGGTNGQEVSRLVNQITNLLQDNRNDITGAAWGSQEDKEYLKKLPNQKDSVASWFGKLEGLLDSAYMDARSTVGETIGGQEIFDSLYGDLFQLNPTTNGGQQQSLNNIFGF